VQVTLALVLLAGAGLMTRGFAALADLYQGFAAERVVTARLDLPERQYPEPPQAAQFYGRVLDGLAATPGIEIAGIVSHLPADLGPMPRAIFEIEGRPALQLGDRPSADLQTVSAGYFGVLSIGLRSGRALSDRDGADAAAVAVVSESLATRFWPGEDPLGRRIRIAGGAEQPWRTVVGVVSDVRQYWYDRDPRSTLYVPYSQSPRRGAFLLARSSLDSAATVSVIRARVREADPDQPIDEVRTMATVETESASFIRLAAGLMVSLGVVALVLAAVGLYGVMADHVAQRRHEIGVRMALGARGTDVLRLVVGEAGRLAVLGIVLGLAGAWVLGRVMASELFGLVRPDVAGLVGVTLVLAGVAFAAAWVPARRAVRVDPLVTLREE
jgi:putative ABC transport system permease protein